MQWLLAGTMTAAVADALKRHGHTPHELAELNLGESPDPIQVLAAAQTKQWDLITNDSALVAAVFDKAFPFSRSIVFLQLPGGDVEQDDAVDRLFARYKRLTPRRLYTTTESRVKIRQLPGGVKDDPRRDTKKHEEEED